MVALSPGARRRSALLAALTLAVVFRLPPLLNANALNSDAAIVGVQARHALAGELALRVWGSPYQASVDVLLAAVLFAFGGSSAFALLLVPLLGMLVMIWLAFSIVSRHAGALGGFLAVLPLIFATHAVNSPMTYVLRQSLATWAVAAVWCFEFASERRRPAAWFALGGALTGLGLLLDTFFVVLVPGLALFGALRAWAAPAKRAALAAVVVSTAVGLASSSALLRDAPPSGSEMTVYALGANWPLLWKQCVPFALGTRVWLPGSVEWVAPVVVHVLQLAAAVLFVGALLSGAVLGLRTRAHALGLVGVMTGLAAMGAFLFSSAPFDMWSTRYLAPLLWFAPFALTPLLVRLGARGAGVVGPWALSALISGWVSYGPYVDGLAIVRTARGVATEELELAQVLRARDVHHARAQYWEAYRLSLLWGEDPLVVPLEENLDRHVETRREVDRARRVAYVFHPSEPRARAADFEADFAARRVRYEKLVVAEFEVLLVEQ